MTTTTITAEQVKDLRDRTGAGMMECKSALAEANGDFEQAVDMLRKRGVAQAAKRAGRATSEGLIGVLVDPDRKRGVMVEVNCETDFVARTDEFRALVDDLTKALAGADASVDHAAFIAPDWPVGQKLAAAIAKTRENIVVPRSVRLAGDHVGSYTHLGKIGVLVAIAGVDGSAAQTPAFRTFVNELAMQIAAANPQYGSRDEVPAEAIEKEKAIYRAQMEGSGKPPQVIEKIVEGKLGSYYEQVVLVDQPSIRDPKVKVSQGIADISTALGRQVKVAAFARFKVGEQA